jgi:hypothetical protein
MIGLYVLVYLIIVVGLLAFFNVGKEYDEELEELYREQKARVEEKKDRHNI